MITSGHHVLSKYEHSQGEAFVYLDGSITFYEEIRGMKGLLGFRENEIHLISSFHVLKHIKIMDLYK